MMDVGENHIQQRCAAFGSAVDDTREPLFRSAVIVCKSVRDAVRVQQKVIAFVYWYNGRSPRRGRQHGLDQGPGAVKPERFARASPHRHWWMTCVYVSQLAFFWRDESADQRDESIGAEGRESH